ncbi:MAG TPA: hypothetical protein VFW75_00480, partial [Acetobacteraceae bacterium]|nr:hypothetical protein [Acetobacteraceae bacterium]
MNFHAPIDPPGPGPDGPERHLLEIRNLRVEYHSRRGRMVALPDFSLRLGAGESLGLVGESG